jgi:hypothetical protein
MSGKKLSNLKNQPHCEATSKRTGKLCRQPKMTGKRVCRFHGGKSTGPKTTEGRERIRQSRLIHGRYSKNAEERRIAIRARRETQKVLSLANEAAKNQIRQFDALAPYLDAYWGVEAKEGFELVNLLVFGHLNQQVKRSPALRRLLQEMFEMLSIGHGVPMLEALLNDFDRHLLARLNVPIEVWEKFSPNEKTEAYMGQFYLKLLDIREALDQVS